MSTEINDFDAAIHPLQRGVNVVEAGAGSGKTFSIAMLVLRFVAELGVPVEQLLVVSYTKAATEELRTRIRKRLVEGRDFLRDGRGVDTVLSSCLLRLSNNDLALQRLELALLNMDRAAVFTIHGFCQRMLQEQALESGQLFDMELTADIRQTRNELVADYWRRQLYCLQPFHCSLFLDSFPTPDALYQSVSGVGVLDTLEPADRILPAQALQEVDEALRSLVNWWQKAAPVLELCFHDAIGQGMFKKKVTEEFASWWQRCQSFFAGESLHLPSNLSWLSSAGVKGELNGQKLRGEEKKTAFVEDWPLAGEDIECFFYACTRAVLSLRITLALELQTGVRERLSRKGRFSFDDLVVLLAKALEADEEQGLQQVLGKRFQVALIDEFQDTDAAQYHIFSTLFGTGNHYLYLIGDPKQAIYKFRGADIFAYFQAKKFAEHLLGLAKNYRSSPLLVQAVNDLFTQREDSFVFPDLPYHQIAPAQPPEAMQLLIGGAVQPGMVYCCLVSPNDDGIKAWTSGKCRERIEEYVCNEIADLLQSGYLTTGNGEKRPVTAGDIAVLVRTNRQAELFREVLAVAAIPAVLSSRISVFASRECADLLLVCQAVAAPGDMTALRTALSCRWFGVDCLVFYEMSRDEKQMDGWMERFYGYHKLWQEKGFFVMMNRLLIDESVLQTLASCTLAERQISNIMHLLELIQEAADTDHLGMSQTLQYVVSMREDDRSAENTELRLESDGEAVQIVTMHGVKGLEYPIVFCPFLWHRSGRLKQEKYCLSCHDEVDTLVTDLGSPDFARRHCLALREELAEDVRLLYVALTRASCRCYAFWADVRGSGFTASSQESGFSWVLSMQEEKDISLQTAKIAELCDGKRTELRIVAAVEPAPVDTGSRFADNEELSCRVFSRGVLPGEWLLSSYSALAGPVPFVPGEYSSAESAIEEDEESRVNTELPFGASFGNVVHALLEEMPFRHLADGAGYEEAVAAQCRRFGVTADVMGVIDLLAGITQSPLAADDGACFTLSDLEETDVLKEMPFYFHLHEGSTGQINELLAAVPTVQPVHERHLKGYLTGFVDLICRHKEKYYIIDYKTNYLGGRFVDYENVKLLSAMREHNYGLQYWIYTLVLHQYLGNTLSRYSYEEDFGGVFYLFARGMHPDLPGNGVFSDRPDRDLLDTLLCSIGKR